MSHECLFYLNVDNLIQTYLYQFIPHGHGHRHEAYHGHVVVVIVDRMHLVFFV